MVRAFLDAIRSAISGVGQWCWWAARLPGQLIFGGSAAPAPGMAAFHEEADAGPQEPPPSAAQASSSIQMDLVWAVRRSAAERLAALDEKREPAVDDRLPHWTQAWLSGLDARQLRLVIQTPGSVLADVLSGAKAAPGVTTEAAQMLASQASNRTSLADRIEARIAARKAASTDKNDGPSLGR